MYTSREPRWAVVQRGPARYIMTSWRRIAFTAQLLAQNQLLPGITVTIKRARMGRVWVTRNERSYERFDRLNEGRQEQHDENHNLRPYWEVREQ